MLTADFVSYMYDTSLDYLHARVRVKYDSYLANNVLIGRLLYHLFIDSAALDIISF